MSIRRTIALLAAALSAGPVIAAPALVAQPADRLAPFAPDVIVVTAAATTPASPNIFGTVALDAGVTGYGARWRRVSAADMADPRITALADAAVAAGPDALTRLISIHVAVNRRVHWRRDLDTYHIAD